MDAIVKSLSGLFGAGIVHAERIGGGRNSRVYRLACEDAKKYAAKFYFYDKIDGRDRLKTEYLSLAFLWKHGIRCIPEPLGCYQDNNCAIYELISGKKISTREVAAADVEFAVHFLTLLKQLSLNDDANVLPAASEACFSPRDLIDNIKARFQNLIVLPADESIYKELKCFLTHDFMACFEKILRWYKKRLRAINVRLDGKLPCADRTLSPSDFGFHNALRQDDGRIVFIDFEYFGWDDPVKMVSDFILHPGMQLAEPLKRMFTRKILAEFAGYRSFEDRLSIAYPLYGLKWCLILLNEFIPNSMRRRKFACFSKSDKAELQSVQLVKARNMAEKMEDEYDCFPYGS